MTSHYFGETVPGPDVVDADGDPVMVITAAPSQSLAAELAWLLPDLRDHRSGATLHGGL